MKSSVAAFQKKLFGYTATCGAYRRVKKVMTTEESTKAFFGIAMT